MDNDGRESLRVLVLPGSLRTDSINSRLADVAAQTVERLGATVDLASMSEFDAPSYDGDAESVDGMPSPAQSFRARIEAAHAFVIVSPEYNASMPGVLKNAIDWVSRARPQPFNQRHGLLMSASPSMVGGNRGLWALRVPLEHLGARIYPDMFSLAQAHTAFADDGSLADERLRRRFVDTIGGFLAWSRHPPTIHASNAHGSSSWESNPTRRSIGSTPEPVGEHDWKIDDHRHPTDRKDPSRWLTPAPTSTPSPTSRRPATAAKTANASALAGSTCGCA